MYSAADVKKLREMTAAGIMDCKQALEDAGGDLDKAAELIKERGLAKAAKKSGRDADAGIIDSYIHNGRVGVLLELNCETDFVAMNDQFKDLARNIAMHVAAVNPENVDELMAQEYVKDTSITVEQLINNSIATIGENIKIGRFARYEL